MVYGGGVNGQWVHVDDGPSVTAFHAIQRIRSAQEQARLRRSDEFRRKMWGKLRSTFRQIGR